MRGTSGSAWPLALALVAVLLGCTKDEPTDPDPTPEPTPPGNSGVNVDLAHVPYDSLSTYRFFTGAMKELSPSIGVLPYQPINALFSDYAHKSRFVWMPSGTHADYVSDSSVLAFPEGAVLIKNFYYDHVQPDDVRKILETRLLIRKNGEWLVADYRWNDAQTEAVRQTFGENVPVQWLGDDNAMHDVIFRIPSETECHTCHDRDGAPIPIGPKPQNLNGDYAFANGTMNQLAKWQGSGYLGSYPSNINTVARWDDPNVDLTDRVRGYVDINCSHCHANGRYCSYRQMRFAWTETADPFYLGVCMHPADPLLPVHTHIVKPGNLEKSLLYYRINSDQDGIRMPLIGRSLIHEEARQLIEQWILSLTQTCN